MWRAPSALLLAAILGGCGFAGVNPRSSGSAPGQFGHQVAAGESIYSIAAQYGTTPEELAARNNVSPPYQLTVGQRLVVPSPTSYVVQSGETMDTIARRYGITPSELARVNGIGAPYTVVPGQTLTIPQGIGQGPTGLASASTATSGPVQVSELPPPGSAPFQTATDAAVLPPAGYSASASGEPVSLVGTPGQATSGAVPTSLPGAVSTPVGAAVSGPVTGPEVTTLQPPDLAAATDAATQTLPPAPGAAAETATEAVSSAPAQAATAAGALPTLSGSGFLSPVTGQMLTAFGEGSPVPNDGVNIAAPRGTPVYASEAGVVAYVGEDIDTFGNLVLVRHADGWVTAYGHNEAILVNEGDVVTRGQTIARVGSTGSVTVPQLHFELRRGTEPVDPMAYLDG